MNFLKNPFGLFEKKVVTKKRHEYVQPLNYSEYLKKTFQ